MNAAMAPRTLYEKLWDSHLIGEMSQGIGLLYIDRHLVHEVTSAQAFKGLKHKSRPLWRTRSVLAVPDHNVPTGERSAASIRGASKVQLDALDAHAAEFELPYIPLQDVRQGIVHVVGPEQGFTLPGTTLVCGDSHTSTHGAFGCLAFGIGTSEVEHVLATQTLPVKKAATLLVQFRGSLRPGVQAKDMALAMIGRLGTAGATGHVIEYAGPAIDALSMEGRMTLCNMAIEAGARAGLIGVDDTTLEALRGLPMAPEGAQWEQAEAAWRKLRSDPGACFDRIEAIDLNALEPQVTWGTSPEMVAAVSGRIPQLHDVSDAGRRAGIQRALTYMGLRPGMRIDAIRPDVIFIGSCTNSRLEDLRSAAQVLRGRHIAPSIRRALVVPGSGVVKARAEAEGLHQVFLDAGFEWRLPGCSMCLGMNGDTLQPGERCASTSNRNFEGRQGAGGRTHLVSPAMAASAAVAGHFTAPLAWEARP